VSEKGVNRRKTVEQTCIAKGGHGPGAAADLQIEGAWKWMGCRGRGGVGDKNRGAPKGNAVRIIEGEAKVARGA